MEMFLIFKIKTSDFKIIVPCCLHLVECYWNSKYFNES